MNRLIAACCAATLVLGAGSAVAERPGELRIAVEGAYPPFSSVTPDGRLVGFDIDIAHALCREMRIDCTLVQQDWDGMIPALLARKYDAIVASMSITPEREKKVAFTDKYYQTPAKFVRRKGSGIEIGEQGLAGVTVGVQRATTHDNFVTETFGERVAIKRYATLDEAYLDALAGRVDLLLADSVALEAGFLDTEQGSDWEFVGPDYTDPRFFGDGIGIALRKGDRELVERFDDAIAAIRADGTYDRIASRYFDFDIYGE